MPPARKLPAWKVALPPVLILAVALALALLSLREQQAEQRASLDQQALHYQRRILRRMHDYELLLRGGLGFLRAEARPDPARWRVFVESLDLDQMNPGSLGVGFSPHVPAARLAAHEREFRASWPEYRVFPPGRRDEYCPVVFLEPMNERNRRAIGYDLYSEPLRREALVRARDTGKASITGKIRLRQETDSDVQAGVLLYLPVYATGAPAGSLAERRAALRGFVSVPVRMADFLNAALGQEGAHLGLAVYDGSADPAALMFEHRPAASGAGEGLSATRTLDVFGRQWTLVFSDAGAGGMAADQREPVLILGLGLLLAAAVYLVIRNIDSTRARAEALARQMTDELRRSEAYNRAVFEHSSMPIGVGGIDGRFIDANQALMDLLGYGREEIIGLGWLDITHPDDRGLNAELTRETLAGLRDSYQMEKRFLKKSGEAVWVSLNVGCLRGEDGAVRFFVGALKDISERKLAETARSESEALFRAMFEDNRLVALLVDPATGRVKDANRAAAAFYGYSNDELRGLPLERINTLPPDLLAQAMAAAGAKGGVFHFEHRLKDGSVRNVQVHSGPFESGGQFLLLSTVLDVTDRLRAEAALSESRERFRELVEGMDEGVVMLDADLRIEFANRALGRMLGLEPAELVGRGGEDFLDPESPGRLGALLDQGRGSPRQPLELRFRRADGRVFTARVRPFPLLGPDGRQRGACGIVSDITAQRAAREAERQRQARRAALLRLHEMRSASRQELLDFALTQALSITDSAIGYIYSYDDTTRLFTLHSWSAGVMEQCRVAEVPATYSLERTGLWGDAVRRRESIMLNDFAAPHPGKKGWPEGHVALSRFLTVPVIAGGRVRAVVGVANKAAPYCQEDEEQLRLFAGGVWDILEQQAVNQELREMTERFHLAARSGRIGLWDWDTASGAVHCDAMMEELYGLKDMDLTGSPEDWLCRVHPEDREALRATLNEALTQGGRFSAPHRVLRPGGGVTHIEASGMAYLDRDGRPLRMVGVNIDATRLREAEQKLAESHRLLQSLIDTLPHTFCCKDAQGRYLLVNKAFAEMRGGGEPGGFAGRTIAEVDPPELARIHEEWDRRALDCEPGAALSYEYPRTAPDGRLEHRLVYKSLVRLPDGRPGIVAINADNTLRKQAEERLAASEALFRTTFDQAPMGVATLSLDRRYTQVNAALCAITGYSAEELLTKTFMDITHPGDLEREMVHSRRLESGETDLLNTDKRYVRKDGSLVWVRLTARLLRDAAGAPLFYVAMTTDITERKQAENALRESEERFRTLAQVSPVGIFRHDATGLCTFVNEQWSRITGYAPEEALGEGWQRILPPEEREEILAAFLRDEAPGQPIEIQSRHIRADGETFWALVRAVPERDAAGRVRGYVGAMVDITERIRMEDALRAAKAQAEAATRTKAQFLANMSHEIRTPLAGVIGTTRLLAQSRLDAEQRRLAEMAVESGRALLDVVNDILDFSKIEAGRLTLRPAPFSLRASLESVAAPYHVLARERGLEFALDVDPDAPDDLVGDEGRLGQVLRNLIGNALKFTESGFIRLEAGLARAEDEAGGGPEDAGAERPAARIRFSVIDTGPGIAPDYLPRIFDSFSQADGSHTRQHGGTGLGLAICKSLVEQMGGDIRVESRLGLGSAFSFTLRLDLAGQPGRLAEAPAAYAAGPASRPGLRVLLAEDNAIGRVLMEHLLAAAGHTVASVGDGEAVLAALAARDFDLVLMDVQMPGMDGLTATRRIRQGAAGAKNAGMALVALTAYAAPEDRARFLAEGLDEVVAKPAEAEVLAAAMQRAVERAGERARGRAGDDAPAGRAAQGAGAGTAADAAPRFDAGYLERSFGAAQPLLQTLLGQFAADSLPGLMDALRRCLESGDWAAAGVEAHRGRGTLGSVGAARAALLARAVERAAAAGREPRAEILALAAELEALQDILRRGEPWGQNNEEGA